jgi:hypothetical protein
MMQLNTFLLALAAVTVLGAQSAAPPDFSGV